MAFTSVLLKTDVVGSQMVQFYTCTFTAVTSGYIKTGLHNVLMAQHNNETTEADGKVKKNIATDGSTAELGGVYFSGFTAGDVVTVEVKGI